MDNNKDLIELIEDEKNEDKKFIILAKKGSGGTSKVFVVERSSTKYAAKVLKEPKEKEQKEEKEHKIANEFFENEIQILTKLKAKINSLNNSYVFNLIDSGIGKIKRKNKEIRNTFTITFNKYLILEYAEKGCLLNYLYPPNEDSPPLDEKYCKRIFYKILKDLQAIHDIKLQNILLDNDFNPKLCDFGFATLNSDNLIGNLGTKGYKAPEISSSYNGFKIDIYSLGMTLIRLVTEPDIFKYFDSEDINNLKEYHECGHYDAYWDILKKYKKKKFTEAFKKLYFKMISYDPKKRPTIEQILKSDWMEEIIKLNENKISELDKKIKDEFDFREILMEEEKSKSNIGIKEKESSDLGSMRSGAEDKRLYFDPDKSDLNISYIDTEKGIDKFIKLKGYLDPYEFMNNIINKIDDKFGKKIEIDPSKKSFKFNIIFTEEEENEENEYDNLNKDCIIQVKLFKFQNEEYLLRFSKKNGDLEEYYNKLKQIINLIKSIF